ncbi:MAG: ParB/RepB/Spo0J family partition protein [Clostridia bacterium]|nr:ParB/RepB/Spo0J family partition protein [Clostridia bacterium]
MALFRRFPVGQVVQLPIAAIRRNPQQPRRVFAEDALETLTQSIQEVGILQPLSVVIEGGEPVLVAGERRLRAAARAGLTQVPCLIVQAEPVHSAVLALVENIQREDLDCFEEAEGIRRLMDMGGLTQTETARRLGLSQPAVANKLRLLQLAEDQRRRLADAGCSERHARALLRLEEPQREQILRRLIDNRWTVAETERTVARLVEPRKGRKVTPIIRDVRLFFNTVNHAVETMKQSGIAARAERRETEDAYEYVIRIPKTSPASQAKRA